MPRMHVLEPGQSSLSEILFVLDEVSDAFDEQREALLRQHVFLLKLLATVAELPPRQVQRGIRACDVNRVQQG
ncbi:MAG TPA: hypothetical protein VIU82_06995 [Bosea sp. (in: a-proteobacteria)]